LMRERLEASMKGHLARGIDWYAHWQSREARGVLLRPATGLAADLLLLWAFAVVLLAGMLLWPLSFRSAVPSPSGFSPRLEQLCAHLGCPEREWHCIVIHHSATNGGGAAAFSRYHRLTRGWKGLAYHFVIGDGSQTADGEVEVGPRWRRQAAGPHAGVPEYNEHGIGICLVGDFGSHRPSERQMRSLEVLVRHLMNRYRIPPDCVLGHREVPGAATECPGRMFLLEEFRSRLRLPVPGPQRVASPAASG